jgi:hypothetical protein
LRQNQMSRATPQMLNFAKDLIACETLEHKSNGAKTSAAFDAVDRLRPPLATLMGKNGFSALLLRSLTLANAEVLWLRAVQVKADGALEGFETLRAKLDPAEFLNGRIVLLAQLLGLLVAFIGPSLTQRMVGEIWPKFLLNDMDFGNGGKNEKTK